MGKYLELVEQMNWSPPEPTLAARYPPDELGEPCPTCGSKEKWVWLNGSRLCRQGVIQGDHLGRLDHRATSEAGPTSPG
jgi:hypothetical protein